MVAEQNSLRAALAVSALSADDRSWLESRLSEDERGRLDLALSQLGERSLAEQAEAISQHADMVLQTGEQQLAGRIGALTAAIAAEPAWLQTAIGHALGTELRGRVLAFMESSETWSGRAAEFRRSWASNPEGEAPALRAALLVGLAASSALVSNVEPDVPIDVGGDRPAWPSLRAWLKKALA